MKKEKSNEIKISDLYLAHIRVDDYLEDYENINIFMPLEKLKYSFNCNNKKYIQIYLNAISKIYLYVDYYGTIAEDYESIIEELSPYYIEKIATITELLEKFKTEKREESNYRNYITPIYEDLNNLFKNKKFTTSEELEEYFTEISALCCYVFEVITEKAYDEKFKKSKVIDINKYRSRHK